MKSLWNLVNHPRPATGLPDHTLELFPVRGLGVLALLACLLAKWRYGELMRSKQADSIVDSVAKDSRVTLACGLVDGYLDDVGIRGSELRPTSLERGDRDGHELAPSVLMTRLAGLHPL